MKKPTAILKNAFCRVRDWFLTTLGDIKVFRFPMFVVFDPDDYQVTGKQVEEIQKMLKPGDCLLRGYVRYLDSKFIPQRSGRTWDGKEAGNGWSHGALYVGDNTVIHAVAEGVSEISLYDFLQCDRIAILRPKSGQAKAIEKARSLLGVGYDFGFDASDPSALYCFELVAQCYPRLGLKKFEVKALFGLLRRNVYLAQSFFDCEKLRLLYVHNPKAGIESKSFTRNS